MEGVVEQSAAHMEKPWLASLLPYAKHVVRFSYSYIERCCVLLANGTGYIAVPAYKGSLAERHVHGERQACKEPSEEKKKVLKLHCYIRLQGQLGGNTSMGIQTSLDDIIYRIPLDNSQVEIR
eukprot:1139049-Pelagomonas_calceolata.AAC.19